MIAIAPGRSRWALPAAVGAAFVLGCLAGHYLRLDSNQKAGFSSFRRPQQFKFVSPLIDCESRGEELTTIRPIKSAVDKAVRAALGKGTITHASVYFRDLQNGPWFGINERDEFAPAALLQLPIVMGILKLADADPSLLNRKLTTPWGSRTLWDIVERMITLSDNTAAVFLMEHLPGSAIKFIYADLGLSDPDDRRFENFIRIKDYASLFRIMFNASYVSPTNSEKGLELLTRSDFRVGLLEGVPKGVVVAHKSSFRALDNKEKQLHDCGIIYTANPYLLCVMTRGTDMANMRGLIVQISRLCHEGVTGMKRPH